MMAGPWEQYARNPQAAPQRGGIYPESTPDYGQRADGTKKGYGYFGELQRPDGDFSTEISVGVDYGSGEKEIPTMVPSLSDDELNYLLKGGEPTKAIINKAVQHAILREKQGKSPFAGPGDITESRKGFSTRPQESPGPWTMYQNQSLQDRANASDIPVIGEDGTPVDPEYEKTPSRGVGESLVGAGETGLAAATGATGGAIGTLAGTAKGIIDELLAGKFGSQEAADRIEQAAARGGEALTYAPRTAAGQEQTQALGEALGSVAGLGPMTGELGALSQAARTTAPTARIAGAAAAESAGDAISGAAQATKGAYGRMTSRIVGDDSLPADRSVGAAETLAANQRQATAEGLPVPVKLTLGAKTRNPDQLAFEKEQIKSPLGQPLRDRAEQNNLQLLQNFDELIDRTGAGAIDVGSTGNAVIDQLSRGYKSAQARTRAAYNAARASDESKATVDLAKAVSTGADDEPNTSLLRYLNSKTTGVPSAAVTDTAKKVAIKLGIAAENESGDLVPAAKAPTVGQLEDFRKEISGIASRTEPAQLRDETILKRLVDAHTEPVAGDLYRAARALRTTQGQKYENRAVVARLLNKKSGSDDPQVAVDQVFQKSIMNASPEEIAFLRKIILTSGKGGRQTWRDLQGATFDHIRNEATKGLGTDSNGQPLISPAKLNQTVSALDKNGRLDVVLGTKNARIVRDLADVSKYISTVPPGTLINSSGTAATLMAAITEAGLLGATSGVPVPVLSALKAISKSVKSKKMQAKIQRSLDVMSKPQK